MLNKIKKYLAEKEKRINEFIDEIPEEFNGIDEACDYNYFLGILDTIQELKNIIGVKENGKI